MADDFRTIAPGIVTHPDVMSGAACIAGTRILPSIIAGRFARGKSVRFLMRDHRLSRLQVEDAIRYTAARKECAAKRWE